MFSDKNGPRLIFGCHVLDGTIPASTNRYFTYDTLKLKTSNKPLDRPINPMAYFVNFSPLALLAGNAPEGKKGLRPIAKGDCVVFVNHEKYISKHLSGEYVSMNSFFDGKLFSALGMVEKSELEINTILLQGYNKKSKAQIDMEQSEDPSSRNISPIRPLFLTLQYSTPDQITLEQVPGFCPSATLRFLPEKLYDLLTDHKLTYDRMCEFVENPGKIQESNNPFELK